MLGTIVGWARLVDNDWDELMQKMRRKLENGQPNLNVKSWLGNFVFKEIAFSS